MTDEDPFASIFPDRGPAPDWMQITIQAPPLVAEAVLLYLRQFHGFKDVDWCVMGRDQDNSRVDYDPCEPLTSKPPN